ncbi:hypothetical protein AB0H29_11525 [Streptomyces thermolilacinus]
MSTLYGPREALADRYRIALDLGVGCGLRQGETFGFSPGDVRGDFVHIERQILMYKSRLYFGPPKGGKERDVPLPKVLAKRLLTHQERFEPLDVTLPWLDPEEPDLAREDRRKVTVPLLVYTGRRGAINHTTWNTKAWKPALADVGVIPPLPERQPGEKPSRVWKPSGEHGFHVLRHTYASVMLEAGESIVSSREVAGALRSGVHAPDVHALHAAGRRPGTVRHRGVVHGLGRKSLRSPRALDQPPDPRKLAGQSVIPS